MFLKNLAWCFVHTIWLVFLEESVEALDSSSESVEATDSSSESDDDPCVRGKPSSWFHYMLHKQDFEREIVDKTLRHLLRRDYFEAISCLDQVIKMNPQLAYYRQRGECYLKVKDYEMAISDLEKLTRAYPDREDFRVLLSQALIGAEKYEEAVRVTLDLDYLVIAALGYKLQSKSKYELAIRCYDKVIELVTDEPLYYKRRGICHYRVKNLEMAILDFQKTIELKPYDLDGRQFWLVGSLVEVERYNEALEALEYYQEKFLVSATIICLKNVILEKMEEMESDNRHLKRRKLNLVGEFKVSVYSPHKLVDCY